MYADRELRRLAVHKAWLRRRIEIRRATCVEAVRRVAAPLSWLDRALSFWHQISPLTKTMALPLGYMAARTAQRRMGIFGTLIQWAPLALAATRGIRGMIKARTSPAR